MGGTIRIREIGRINKCVQHDFANSMLLILVKREGKMSCPLSLVKRCSIVKK